MRLESTATDVPTLFLDMGTTVGELLAHPDVERRWTEPSALENLTIGALAAHLGRAFTTAWLYLQADACEGGDDVDAAVYFVRAFDRPDEDMAELDASIVQRAHDDAEQGAAGVRDLHDRTVADLRSWLADQSTDRGIEVFGGLCMPLGSYLVTRMVEAAVHTDDLAVSLGVETPTFDRKAMDLVMGALVGVARERHGDIAMVREFARRERASGDRLPVL